MAGDDDAATPRPGAGALLAMKEQTSSRSVFKVPKVPQQQQQQLQLQPIQMTNSGSSSKEKMTILTEEQYVEELGRLIEKDFFPDLEKLRAQNQYLDAVERNDLRAMRELHAKYSGGHRPTPRSSGGCESPATFETPAHNPDAPATPAHPAAASSAASCISSARSTTSTAALSAGHTLDSFLTHYTSEDNNSFHEIIEAADRRLRCKFAVLYAAESQQAKQMALALALPDIERQFEAIEGAKRVETWTYRNKNYIMYVPEGRELTGAEQLEAAKRRMEISYENTRLRGNPFDERQSKEAVREVARTNARGQVGRIGVDGNYIDAAANAAAAASGGGPLVRGFGFVKTPSPAPGAAGESPLMTWGEIEGTPFRLDGGDTPVRPMAGPSFRISETSRRENIALELADKVCERKRGQKARAIEAARRNIGSPLVRSTLERLASMSPAAKRLASVGGRRGSETPVSRAGFSPAASATCFGGAMLQRQSGRLTPSPQLVRRKTPAAGGGGGGGGSARSLMTDDLLRIPGTTRAAASAAAARKQASDFF